ncbi:MAG: group 1 truncated hemoglobin [Bryobacter sp.]|nr:group 1 truncated hemoglobin [Bryobacter sp. CoA8 C33]
MSNSSPTLFDRIGGDIGISLLIDRFYKRVLADPALAPFFLHLPMDKLRQMQFEFFTAALGAPARSYSGRPLDAVHKGLGITSHHLDLFLRHLLDTIEFLHPNESERREIYDRIALFGESVLDSPIEGTE